MKYAMRYCSGNISEIEQWMNERAKEGFVFKTTVKGIFTGHNVSVIIMEKTDRIGVAKQ